MKKRLHDRGLLQVAQANIKAARRDLAEGDEIFANFALFNVSQAVGKLMKFLCACNGIDYDYSHFLAPLADKLLEAGVEISALVQESMREYGEWTTRARYTSSQMVQRSYIEKQIDCVQIWINTVAGRISIF